jgi:phage-related minor tail protein
VVDRPTVFPFARGVGLMGEAGAEAIMPLQRDASGRLGVKAQGGRSAAPISISVAGASVTIQGNADQSTIPAMKQMLDQYNRDLPGRVVAAVRDAQARGKI